MFWAYPKIGVVSGITLEAPDSGVIPVKVINFSWDDGTTPEVKKAFAAAWEIAKKAGLKTSIDTENLSGYRYGLTIDLEVLILLKEIAETCGFCNKLSLFFLPHWKLFVLCE